MRISSLAIIIAVVVVVLIGWAVAEHRGITPKNGTAVSTMQEVSADEWIKGTPDASVTLIEYSDFQCPACRAYQPMVSQLAEEFGDKIAVAYRHFPLRSIHRNAEAAARAAEAAGVQGKFWEMHDALFDGQSTWSALNNPQETFEFYAKDLGLDVERFKADSKSDAVKERVGADYASGVAARISGTPTFFLNGQRIENPAGYEAFKVIVENALKS